LLTARVSDFESELTLSKGELHFLESSLKQKLAELSDTNNDLKRAIAEADDWRAKYSTATDKYAGMELNLNEKTSALEHVRIRHEELEQHVITKNEENKLLKVEIETIKLKISEQEGVKESIVARLREVEGRLVTTEADRLSFLISRDKLIEQIVHENRPLLSLKRSSLKRKVNLLRNANLVDEAWYLNQYPDVKAAMLDPTLHYLQYGKAEGRKPRG
jgi:chromosome segregation ATPase